jgi:hypothetical protein
VQARVVSPAQLGEIWEQGRAAATRRNMKVRSFEFLLQVGALRDVRAELNKLRGTLFFKVVEDLHLHLYNKGDYRSETPFCFSLDKALCCLV